MELGRQPGLMLNESPDFTKGIQCTGYLPVYWQSLSVPLGAELGLQLLPLLLASLRCLHMPRPKRRPWGQTKMLRG